MTVFALWSPPRARSTAFFRSMLERGDLLALHEPLEGLVYFGSTEVGGRAFTSLPALLTWLVDETADSKVFLKETTDHQVLAAVRADRRFLAEAKHTFLIRRPEEIAASAHSVIASIRAQDPEYHEVGINTLGLEALHGLYVAVRDATGRTPLVIDSDDLVSRPAATMAAYCEAMGLPFIPAALHWEPGERPEWQRSARWHAQVSRTSGFEQRAPGYADTVETSADLARFAAHHRPFYDELFAQRLRIPDGGNRS
jgi:hypothetical protein